MLLVCPQLAYRYFPVWDTNNCIDHALWAIKEVGGYETLKEASSIKSLHDVT
jgi:hypothetical protein